MRAVLMTMGVTLFGSCGEPPPQGERFCSPDGYLQYELLWQLEAGTLTVDGVEHQLQARSVSHLPPEGAVVNYPFPYLNTGGETFDYVRTAFDAFPPPVDPEDGVWPVIASGLYFTFGDRCFGEAFVTQTLIESRGTYDPPYQVAGADWIRRYQIEGTFGPFGEHPEARGCFEVDERSGAVPDPKLAGGKFQFVVNVVPVCS